jgi:predicted nuclease with TOPRIM domain
MRTIDRRVQRVEERIAREIAALRADMKLRLESMQSDLARELEGLSKRLAEEQLERARNAEAVTKRLDGAADAVESRLEELRGEAAAAHEELRLAALEDAQAIRAEHAGSRHEDQKRLARMFAQLARFLDEGPTAAPKPGA